jgi:hypothetical protein
MREETVWRSSQANLIALKFWSLPGSRCLLLFITIINLSVLIIEAIQTAV